MADLPLYIRMFGPFCVQCGEQEINHFGTAKNAALLAYLACNPGVHYRFNLAELFWPGSEESKARRSLAQAVHTLKSKLAPYVPRVDELLVSDNDTDTLLLDARGFGTDVAAFEAALRAAKAAGTDVAQAHRHWQRAADLSAAEFMEGNSTIWAQDKRNEFAGRHEEALQELEAMLAALDLASDSAASEKETMLSDAALRLRFVEARTRFFGRMEEIREVCTLLGAVETRIVTLTGMAGIGKTRLALRVAQKTTAMFGQNICSVPLADVHEAGRIPARILHALGLYEDEALPPIERIKAHFQGQPALLILDNFEQLADVGSSLVELLLNQIPELKVLVTSRRLLHVGGEREFALHSLPTPDAKTPVEILPEYPSIALFQDRVQQKRADFRVTPANAPTVIEICRILEGIPLAIELAAAHERNPTPIKILAGLNQRLKFLVSSQSDGEPRHRSLQAALQWSYDSLAADLQRFFARLSVFQDGWTAEAAQAVCKVSQAGMFLELLQARSLIILDESSEDTRYRMLETIREFAAEQLTTEERSELAAEHARYFVDFAQEAAFEMMGAKQKQWLRRIERDRSNLNIALNCILQGSSPELAHYLITALSQMWFARGYYSEGQSIIMELLPKVAHPDTRARMLNVVGVMAEQQGNYEKAIAYLQECLPLAQVAANLGTQANALGNLGLIAWKQGKCEEARTLLEESLSLDLELGNPRNIIITRLNLSNVLQAQSDIAGARQVNTENLKLARKEKDAHAMAWSLGNLGQLARLAGDLSSALDCCRESLAILAEMPDEQGMATMLEEIAFTLQAQGRSEQALCLLGTAEATRERLQTPLAPVDRPTYDACLAAAANALSVKTRKRVLAKGRTAPLAQVVASLLEDNAIQ